MDQDGTGRFEFVTENVDRACVIMGVPVDDVTLAEAVDVIGALVERGRSTGRSHQVATVNVDFVVNAARDPRLLEILQRTDLAIPDGMPLVWASRLLDSPLRARTTGIDLVPALASRAVERGHRITLFGGAPGVADRAAAMLRKRAPGLAVTVVGAGEVAADGTTDPVTIGAVRDTQADIVLVALGNPKQERWIDRHAADVRAPVFVGIGGSLDFLTGVTRRAPEWMQRTGLEWLHRAVSEPRRLIGRYARDFIVFVPGLARQLWTGRRRPPAVVPLVRVRPDVPPVMTLLGPMPRSSTEGLIDARVRAGDEVVVDLAQLSRLDNATTTTLVGIVRQARRTGAPVRIVDRAASARVERATDGLGALLQGPKSPTQVRRDG